MIIGLVGNNADTQAVSARLAGHGFHELENEHEIRLFNGDNLLFSNIRHEFRATYLRDLGALIIHIVRAGDESGDYGVAIHPCDAVVSANGSNEGLFDRVRAAIDKRVGVVA